MHVDGWVLFFIQWKKLKKNDEEGKVKQKNDLWYIDIQLTSYFEWKKGSCCYFMNDNSSDLIYFDFWQKKQYTYNNREWMISLLCYNPFLTFLSSLLFVYWDVFICTERSLSIYIYICMACSLVPEKENKTEDGTMTRERELPKKTYIQRLLWNKNKRTVAKFFN